MSRAEDYERAFGRTRSLVTDEVAGTDVPTCPGWTVKDVVAHNAGFITTYLNEGMEGFSNNWGDRVVDARKGKSLDECLSEWARLVEEPGDIFESRLAPVAVADVLAHEQDIRTAIDRPGGTDDPGILPAVEMGLSFLEQKIKGAGLPAFRIVTDEFDRTVGEGEPAATLKTSTFELFRTLHGRRTVDQFRSMNWDGDPDPWADVFFLFGPAESVVEK